MAKTAAWVVVVAVGLVACGNPAGPEDADVTAELTVQGMVVENGRDAPIHYFLVERATAALIDWLACVDDTYGTCPTIDARSSRLFPWAEIPGWGPEAEEVLFYWWHAVPDPNGGLRIDSVRVIIVGE